MKTIRLGLVVVVLSLLATACMQGGQGGGEEGGGGFKMPPTPVVVEPVVMLDYAPAIELIGEVRATQRAVLSAEIGGRVTKINHRVGEEHLLRHGALVQVNTADYQAVLSAAKAGQALADEALLLAQNGPRSEDIAAQQAAVDAARAQYDLALDNLGRQEDLFEQGVISESMLIAAKTQAQAAQAALDAQHEVLNSMIAGTRPEQVAQAQASVDAAASQVRQAELTLSKTAIKPAFDAVVTDMMVEVGSMVGPGTPVAEVVALGPGEAWFNLPEGEVSGVHPGDAVELTFDALPDVVIQGSVISVSPAADPMTRQFPLRVAIGDDRPLPGMVANGRILMEQAKPTVMISRDAAVLNNLGLVAFTMQPPAEDAEPPMPGMPPLPTVNMVHVELGDNYGDYIVVLSEGLAPGMMVVTRGNEQLFTGANIIPTNLMGEGGPGGPGAPGGEGVPPGGTPEGGMLEGEIPTEQAPPAAPEQGAEVPPAEAGAEQGGGH